MPAGLRPRAAAGRARQPLRRLLRSAAALLAVGFAVTWVQPAEATYATGGSGIYRTSIDWFEWGANNVAIPAAGLTRTNTRTINGVALTTTCTLSNVTGSMRTYRSGDWRGDALDNLYNVGGIDAANTMVAGLANSVDGAPASFRFACSAAYGGTAVPLAGLVVADAESTTNIGGEFIQAGRRRPGPRGASSSGCARPAAPPPRWPRSMRPVCCA